MATYADKLKNPKWQKKRLKILERAKWKCELCSDEETELHVHHLEYSGEPWEVPDDKLQCLCKDCHELISGRFKDWDKKIVKANKRIIDKVELWILEWEDKSTGIMSYGESVGYDMIIFKHKSTILEQLYKINNGKKVH